MIDVDVVHGRLAATIYEHEVMSFGGPVSCWSYLTDGLRKTGQKELLLTVSRRLAEEAPSDLPRQFFAQIWQLATEGDLVDAGGYSDFFKSGFLGPFSGVIYARAQALSGVPAGAGTLAALLVTDEELNVARKCGTSRVITRLGDVYRHFPFPPWTDRSRSSVVTPAFWQESILAKLPLPWHFATGTRVRQDDGRLRLSLRSFCAPAIASFLSKFEPAYPVVFRAEPDPDADALLVWQPGQQDPQAIAFEGSPGKRVGGCFVAFSGHDETNVIQLAEDGFLMRFTAEGWAQIRRALQSGLPAAVPGPDGLPIFELSWKADL
jgi:hypothetical protein